MSKHGTRYRYVLGCRCGKCVAASRAYYEAWRRKRGIKPKKYGRAHGASGYSGGCRCKECRAWNTAYHHNWRERARGTEPPAHGLGGYKNYGCRCDVCRAAQTAHTVAYRARQKTAS